MAKPSGTSLHVCRHSERREQRRVEAEARKAAYNALSIEAKLARLDGRPGQALKERGRLGA